MSDIAIKVENLSKCYPIFDTPRDRLKQMIIPRLQRAYGFSPRKYFREFWALRDVSFEVKRGQTVGIIGRNGSGKSTLLQLICGTLAPTGGTLQVNGRVAALLELGSGFNPDFTGRENVYLNASILGLSNREINNRFKSIVDFAEIGDFIEQPVKTYSSGMLVRLAFAVAINVDPEILIVDEALAVGDFVFQQKCYSKIKKLQESGTTIFLVSHDLASIVQFCNWAHVIQHGKMIYEGSAKNAVNFFKQITTESNKKINYGILEHNSKPSLSLHYNLSSNIKNYGNKCAEIYDWGIFDQNYNLVSTFSGEEECEILIRIKFNKTCLNPIVGYFFTDKQGREIVGSNSDYLGFPLGSRKSGEKIDVKFKQCLGLAHGEYSLNIGCSEFICGELIAYHRLYELSVFTITRSSRNVGFFLPPTVVDILDVK